MSTRRKDQICRLEALRAGCVSKLHAKTTLNYDLGDACLGVDIRNFLEDLAPRLKLPGVVFKT